MIQQTSLIAFEQIQHNNLRLTHSYMEIMQCLAENYGMTDQEIAKKLGYSDPNKIRPRRNELVKAGFLTNFGKKKCKISGKSAIFWDLTHRSKSNFEELGLNNNKFNINNNI